MSETPPSDDLPTGTRPADARPAEDQLGGWWRELSAALDLVDVPIDRDVLLALAGEAAHGVVRPAAPLTTFLAGYAAGLAGGGEAALEEAVAASRTAIQRRARAF